jgi:Acyl dehydratase
MQDDSARSTSDLSIGQSASHSIVVTDDTISRFIQLSGDRAPAHTDAAHARAMGFDGCIAHGFLVTTGYSRLLGEVLPGPDTVIHSVDLQMTAPVYSSDTLTYTVRVAKVSAAVQTVRLDLQCTKQDGTVVNRGSATCVFRR